MYQALYRKYRPKDFDSVVGQNPIIKTLQNSIKNNTFSHAYLFYGPRGTGKTTVSKIFARNVNCLDNNDGIACGKCSSCKVSFSYDCMDIIEIDAASNNGVDEIRELKNNINLVPSELKYKVYIIDEVHMLSTGAFNALLKTLEEPPEHVIFILATTDPQKVPETIVSRCQCFSFKRISDDVIFLRLSEICKNENIDIDDDVLKKISLLSEGGLRDALGMLDKVISYSNDKVTIDDFNDINGVVSDDDLFLFIKNIINGNVTYIINELNNYNNSGKNLVQILIQLINVSRNIIVDYYLNDKSVSISIDLLQEFVNLINEKMYEIKKSGDVKIFLEILILKFINDHNLIIKKDVDNLYDENNIVVEKDTNLNKNDLHEKNSGEFSEEIKNENKFKRIINLEEINEVRINNTMAKADKKILQNEKQLFEILKDFSFDQEVGAIVNNILDSKLRACSVDNIIISYSSDAIVEENNINIMLITELYNKITKSNKNIVIVSDAKWNSIKNEYIDMLKNKKTYEVLEEPEVLFEDVKNDDIIVSSAIDLFGEDIVEFE